MYVVFEVRRCYDGVLAQLGEHLPYKQGVIGSSPIRPILKIVNLGRYRAGMSDLRSAIVGCADYVLLGLISFVSELTAK